jgi:hypothetical protein
MDPLHIGSRVKYPTTFVNVISHPGGSRIKCIRKKRHDLPPGPFSRMETRHTIQDKAGSNILYYYC